MAINLPENEGYVAGITRLEKTYKARGGAVIIDEITGDPVDGDLNLPLQQLASRTKALRDGLLELEETVNEKVPFAPVTEIEVDTPGNYFLNIGAEDNGKFFTINITNNEAQCLITPASIETLPLGWETHFTQMNAVYSLVSSQGTVYGDGVQVAEDYSPQLRTQYSVATIKKVSSDTLVMFGDLILTSDLPSFS